MVTRVFLSSRFEEFKHLRFGLKNGPDSALEFVELDDGRAATETPLERSLQSLEGCDLFLLFLGKTIGAPVDDGLSIVELEWKVANELSIPCLHYFTTGLIDHLKNPDGTLDSRLVAFAERVMERGHVVGKLYGDDSAKILADVNRWLTGGKGIAAPNDAASRVGEFWHDGGFVNVVSRKSRSYGLPLDDAGPEFQREILHARASSLDALQRRMPEHAFEMIQDAVSGKNRVDLSSVWYLGEMLIRYQACIPSPSFSTAAMSVVELLRKQAKAVPIGDASSLGAHVSRHVAVLSTRSRLLLSLIGDSEARAIDDPPDDPVGVAIQKCWSDLRESSEDQLDHDDKDEFVVTKFRFAALIGDIAEIRAIFFSVWHWKPGLALDLLGYLPEDSADDVVESAVAEAVRDFQEVFGTEISELGKTSGATPRARLTAFRRGVRQLVERELCALTELLVALDPDVVERLVRLLSALRFPSVYLPRYRPNPSFRRQGDIFRVEEKYGSNELEGYPLGIYNLAVDGRFPLHWYDGSPDLEDLRCVLTPASPLIASPSNFLRQALVGFGSINVVRAEAATRRAATAIDSTYRGDAMDEPRDFGPSDRISHWTEAWAREVETRKNLNLAPRLLFPFEESILRESGRREKQARDTELQRIEADKAERRRLVDEETTRLRAEIQNGSKRLLGIIEADCASLGGSSASKPNLGTGTRIAQSRLDFLFSTYGKDTLRHASREGGAHLQNRMISFWLLRTYENCLDHGGRIRLSEGKLSVDDLWGIRNSLFTDLPDYENATLKSTQGLPQPGSFNDEQRRNLWRLLGFPETYENP